jgi:hypothetical protein
MQSGVALETHFYWEKKPKQAAHKIEIITYIFLITKAAKR